MTVTTLTDTEFRILDALRVYRYLTAEQMLRLKGKRYSVPRSVFLMFARSCPSKLT